MYIFYIYLQQHPQNTFLNDLNFQFRMDESWKKTSMLSGHKTIKKNKTTILTSLSLADTTTPAKCKLKTIEKTLKRLRILTNIEEIK